MVAVAYRSFKNKSLVGNSWRPECVRAGVHPSLVVATATPPTPGHTPLPSKAEEVGLVCRQLPQCVGSCDLQQEASTSGRSEDHVMTHTPPMKVCYLKTCTMIRHKQKTLRGHVRSINPALHVAVGLK